MNKADAVKKGVEAMKMANKETKEEKVLKIADIQSLLENLTVQYNQFNQIVNENQTRLIETRGAIAVANAQLQGLENDSKPTN